nr:DNA repair and recombination protein RadA [Candidatus Sigynarchaeota archaeon]
MAKKAAKSSKNKKEDAEDKAELEDLEEIEEPIDVPLDDDEIEGKLMASIGTEGDEEIEKPDDDIDADDGTIEFPGEGDPGKVSVKNIPGVGPSTAKKLIESGYANVKALATVAPKVLQDESGIGEKAAQKIVQAAQELLNIGFTTADVVLEKRRKLGKIVTGSATLNEILGGGIEAGAMTEFYGEFRTGKTQIAHQCCVNVQLPEDQGGLNGKALYIDTEGTFRPERIAQMALAKSMDPNVILRNVIYARAYNSEHQVNIIRQARRLIEKENIKLIVVDSIIGHFRSEYLGLGSLGPRQQLLNSHLHNLMYLAETYSLAIILTNQVQAKPDIFFGNPIIAAGGNILGHGSTYRLYLRRGKADTRVAKMVDAPGLPEAEAVFKISEKGIEDIE